MVLNGVKDLTAIKTNQRNQSTVPYLFHVSRLAAKKNVHLLIQMMKYLPDYELVIAGKGHSDYEQQLHRLIDREGLHNVALVGRILEDEKAFFYRHCVALAFPSISEGFGLPVIEAMYFGKPVFLSRLTALPEIGGDVAYYFDKLEPRDMAEVVRRGLAEHQDNEAARSQLIRQHAATFSWEKATESYIEYYKDILATDTKG